MENSVYQGHEEAIYNIYQHQSISHTEQYERPPPSTQKYKFTVLKQQCIEEGIFPVRSSNLYSGEFETLPNDIYARLAHLNLAFYAVCTSH